MPDKTGDNLVNDIFGDNRAVNEPILDEQAPVNTGEPETEKQIQEPEKLLAGKFKTVEEMERAYEEAQRWGTRNAQEAAQIRRELEQLRQSVAPDQTRKQQEEWDAYAKQVIAEAVVNENPAPLMQMIDYMVEQRTEQKLWQRDSALAPVYEQQRFQAEVNAFLTDNPEAGEYIDDMAMLIKADPELVTMSNWLPRVYGKVLNQKLKGSAASKTKTEAAKAAASMPESGPRSTQDPEGGDDKLRRNIFGDMSQKRKMWDF